MAVRGKLKQLLMKHVHDAQCDSVKAVETGPAKGIDAIGPSGRRVKNVVRQGRWAVGQGAENNRRLARPMKRAPNPVQPLEVRTEL